MNEPKRTQEGRSYDQLHGTHFLKWHFILLLRSLCMVTPRFQRARIQTDTELFKKNSRNMEFFHVDLPPLTSFSSVVSIRIRCHRCKNFCVAACTKPGAEQLWEHFPLKYTYGTRQSYQDTSLGKYPGLWSSICSNFALLVITSAWTPELVCTLSVACRGWDTWRLQQEQQALPQICIPTRTLMKALPLHQPKEALSISWPIRFVSQQ